MIHEPNTNSLPVFFGTNSHLFGWIVRPETPKNLPPVIICNPTGYELIRCHETVRHLAGEVAGLGHTVLRFDYTGTGDSKDLVAGQDAVPAWLDDIGSAVDFACEVCSCDRAILVGIRLGGTLAAIAAGRKEIRLAIMWEPVVSGSAYIREMQILASTAKYRAKKVYMNGSIAVEAAGFAINDATSRAIESIKLADHSISISTPVLLLERDDIPASNIRYDALMRSELNISRATFGGYNEMLRMPLDSSIPQAAIETICSWLQRTVPEDVRSPLPPALRSQDLNADTALDENLTEQAIRFGDNERLFGLLTRSRSPSSGNRPNVILLCGGAVPHYSANRMYTPLARGLASQGFNVLRMDMTGIGDSGEQADCRRNNPYAETAMDDIQAAVDYLTAKSDTGQTALVGLCSGAFAAMQYANNSPDVTDLVLINQLVYYLSADDVEACARNTISPALHLDYPRHKSTLDRILRRSLSMGGTLGSSIGRLFTRRLVGGPLASDLKRLAKRGTHLSFVLSKDDPAVNALKLAAGRTVSRLVKDGCATVKLIPNADHIFSPIDSQADLLQAVKDCLIDSHEKRS